MDKLLQQNAAVAEALNEQAGQFIQYVIRSAMQVSGKKVLEIAGNLGFG